MTKAYAAIAIYFLIKLPKICAREKTASSTNGTGKIGFLPAEN
jgi:hypothetical protein